jgi:uncharacterized protein (DUF2267 family)
MSQSGLSAFDHSLHTTHKWLKELMESLRWEDRQHAYHALRAVLHVLRDHLTIDEVANLGAQLPLLIRGMYYEGWHPSKRSQRKRKKAEFLEVVSEELPFTTDCPIETIVREVFQVLSHHVSQGEIEDVKHLLSRECRALWEDEWFPTSL